MLGVVGELVVSMRDGRSDVPKLAPTLKRTTHNESRKVSRKCNSGEELHG
jgi:hypothetical protein